MKTHELKLDTKYFEDVKSGKKNFEIRNNDRGFEIGDILELRAFIPPGGTETSGYYKKGDEWVICDFDEASKIIVKVTHILSAKNYNILVRSGTPSVQNIKKTVQDYFMSIYISYEYVVLGIEVVE